MNYNNDANDAWCVSRKKIRKSTVFEVEKLVQAGKNNGSRNKEIEGLHAQSCKVNN